MGQNSRTRMAHRQAIEESKMETLKAFVELMCEC